MRVAAAGLTVYEKVSGFSGYLRPEVEAVDRSLHMRITDIHAEAEDVVSLRLEHSDGARLPTWHPGAHVDVDLPSGKKRQYSLCGDPRSRDHYRIAVRRIANG